MSCYHPMHLYKVGIDIDGKQRVKVISGDYLGLDEFGYPTKLEEFVADEGITIPCGHCIGCRQDQSKEWASRLMMEMIYHDSSYFVTLTYNEDNVPIAYDENTGCVSGLFTLDKRDPQLFMKRLRKACPNDKIRFYLAGEYGENTGRPHYHAILFGLHLNDLKPFGRSETGNQYFISGFLDRVWNKGFVSVEPANYATCKYVASYVTKKIGIHPNKVYEDQFMVPPFSLSSRKPGIGYQYYDEHPEILDTGKIILGTANGSYEFMLPRYFKKKFSEQDPDRYDEMVLRHQRAAADRKEMILDNTSVSYKDYLSMLEKRHEDRVKRRDKI